MLWQEPAQGLGCGGHVRDVAAKLKLGGWISTGRAVGGQGPCLPGADSLVFKVMAGYISEKGAFKLR